jgi:hypothetical protein
LTSVFEAADFSLVLDDVASVLPALLVAAFVRTLAPGMYAPYINVSLSITLIKLIHLNDRFLNRNTYKYANKKIVNIPLMKYIEANYNLIVTHSSCFYIDQINTLITRRHEWLPCQSNGTLLNNTQFAQHYPLLSAQGLLNIRERFFALPYWEMRTMFSPQGNWPTSC